MIQTADEEVYSGLDEWIKYATERKMSISLTLIRLGFLRVVFSWEVNLAPHSCFIKDLYNINITIDKYQRIHLKNVESEKMLTSSVITSAISFFVTRKCQKIEKKKKINENQ